MLSVPSRLIEPVLALPSDLLRASTVAVIRDGGLGDVVMLTASLHHLVWSYPHLRLDVYTQPAYGRLLAGDPLIRNVFSLPQWTRYTKKLYDVVFDCRMLVERTLAADDVDRTMLFGLKMFGEPPDTPPCVYAPELTEEEQAEVDAIVAQAGEPPRIAIAPWSARPYADWPHTQALVDTLLSRGIQPLLIDNREERLSTIHGAIPVNTSLACLCHVLLACSCVVAVDSGIFHLAAALDGATCVKVGLFGPVPAALRTAYYTRFVAHEGTCQHGGCSGLGTCAKPGHCMATISPHRVAKTIWEVLGL